MAFLIKIEEELGRLKSNIPRRLRWSPQPSHVNFQAKYSCYVLPIDMFFGHSSLLVCTAVRK